MELDGCTLLDSEGIVGKKRETAEGVDHGSHPAREGDFQLSR
jgi:hypothetical protein